MTKRKTTAIDLGRMRGEAKGEIARLERISAQVATALAAARQNLESLDRVWKIYDDRVDPTRIKPIPTKKILRGSKGGLSLAIKAVLAEAPDGLLTTEVAWAIQLTHSLHFETPEEQLRWERNTIRPRLRQLHKLGDLGRVLEENVLTEGGTQQQNRWRLKSTSPDSLAELAESTIAEGGTVRYYDADSSDDVPESDDE